MTRAERLAVAALVSGAAVLRLPTLAQPLIEAHAFRQTQTAYTALLYARDGIDLLHPRVPVLGAPYTVAFEFPLFQALAALPVALGVAPDVALRALGSLFFLVSAVLLWRLVRRLAGVEAGLATLVAYLFSPFGLLWSRTATIEFLVIAAALVYLYAGIVWRERGGGGLYLLAIVAGAIAMAVKITSGAIWALPLIAYRSPRRTVRDTRLMALVVIPVGLALVWTRYADQLRAASPGTAWMSGAALAPFLFGTAEEHLQLAAWMPVLHTLGAWICGPMLIGVAMWTANAVREGAQRLFWTAAIVSPVLSVMAFLHVWSIHDYYSIAATPSVAVALGLAAAWLWRRGDLRLVSLVLALGVVISSLYMTQWVPAAYALAPAAIALLIVVVSWSRRREVARAFRPAFLVAGGLAVAANLVFTVNYWGGAYASPSATTYPLMLAAELERWTAPDEAVLMTGADWSPVVLYYARRQGQMLPAALLEEHFVATLHSRGYRTFFSWDPAIDALWPAAEWRWTGALGPHTYALGDERTALRGAKAASTDDPTAFDGGSSAARRIAHPSSIRCGEVTEIAAGATGTWLRFAAAGRDARVTVVAAGLGAMPARMFLAISPQLAEHGTIRLGCAGAQSLDILDAVDAP